MADTPDNNMAPGFWASRRGQWIATVGALVVALSMLFGNLGGIGVWEPWEANEIAVAQEYATRGAPPELTDPKATSWNEVVPTHKNRPVDRSLLKTWLMAKSVGDLQVDGADIGTLERRARMPIALATFLLVVAGFVALRRRFGTFRAAVASAVFCTIPATYLGVHNLAAEMLFVVTTTLAILAFAELMFEERASRKWLWGTLFGVSLALAVLDQRLLGLYLPLLILAVFAVGEVCLGELVRQRDGPSAPRRFGAIEIGGAALCGAGIAAVTAWALGSSDPEGETPAYALQIVGVVAPALSALGGFWFARRSKPGRALFSLPGLLGLGIGVLAALWLARTYTDANPILLDGGKMFGEVQVLAYMLSNHVFERSLVVDHMTFEIAVRQVGFSLFPWVALFPAGFVFIARSTQSVGEDGEPAGMELFEAGEVTKRLLLVWIVAAAVVMGAASAFEHYFYPAYFPIAASIGLVLTDTEFWRRARRHPLAPYALGFVGVTIILMLGKDLERFPSRFIETYLALQEGFEFPEDFVWGELFKPLKYALCALLIVHFFGLFSWAVIAFGKMKRAGEFFSALKRRDWSAAFGEPTEVPPHVARMQEKEAIRASDAVPGRIARWIETPLGFAPVAVLVFWIAALLFLFSFVPNVTNHLSQRGVFETYTQLADDDEALYRYQVSSRDNSVYLQDVETIKGTRELEQMFGDPERFFAVIPRSKLAAINYEIRQKFKQNLAVLDARSSRLLLVSNKLEEGEKDQNFVADKIVEGDPDVQFPVEFESDGEMKHPVFDDQLEFLGYSLDGEQGENGMVRYGWGDTMTITYYFNVLKRVPSSQKIFLHVDYPGNRINGDHVPNDGEFTTNYWMPGDTVKDVHRLSIDSYSTPGVYTLNMGFFLGSRRMKVQPKEAHDGRDRITIGKIRVTSGL